MSVSAVQLVESSFNPHSDLSEPSPLLGAGLAREKVTIVLPAYNEATDLPTLLKRISSELTREGLDFRVVVVDDGSTDGTGKAALEAGSSMTMALINHPKNLGLGAALRTGLLASLSGEGVVIVMDADNSHDPAIIPAMLRRIAEGYDVVIASRFQPGAKVIGVKLYRRILSHFASWVGQLLSGYPNVLDYSSGYRAYRVSILRKLRDQFGNRFVTENGFACMFEVLLKLRVVKARVVEVPFTLRYDQKTGRSKMNVCRTIWRYLVIFWQVLPSIFFRPRVA